MSVSINVPAPPQVIHELAMIYLENTYDFKKGNAEDFAKTYDDVHKQIQDVKFIKQQPAE